MGDKLPHLHLGDKTFFELVFGQEFKSVGYEPTSGEIIVRGKSAGKSTATTMAVLGKANEICFTNGVNAIRQPQFIDSPRLNASAQVMFDNAGGRVPVVLMGQQGTLRFWAEGAGKKAIAAVMIPANFYVTCFMEPVAAMEALAFVSSMVKDYCCGHLKPANHAQMRAVAHNAEMLRALVGINPGLVLSGVQVDIVRHLPHGFASCPADLFYD